MLCLVFVQGVIVKCLLFAIKIIVSFILIMFAAPDFS